jgi:hypothetical protein
MFMSFTPWAGRPWREMPLTPVRWTIPVWEMNTSSWCSRTTSAPTSAPFLPVIVIVLTPIVPRFLRG